MTTLRYWDPTTSSWLAAQGPQGPQGLTGSQGAQGPQGPQGPQGAFPSGAGGDLAGTYPNPSVIHLPYSTYPFDTSGASGGTVPLLNLPDGVNWHWQYVNLGGDLVLAAWAPAGFGQTITFQVRGLYGQPVLSSTNNPPAGSYLAALSGGWGPKAGLGTILYGGNGNSNALANGWYYTTDTCTLTPGSWVVFGLIGVTVAAGNTCILQPILSTTSTSFTWPTPSGQAFGQVTAQNTFTAGSSGSMNFSCNTMAMVNVTANTPIYLCAQVFQAGTGTTLQGGWNVWQHGILAMQTA